LDKYWLMGVRRGWLSLMKPSITDWASVNRALERLKEFVENLQTEISFNRPSPKHRTGDEKLKKAIADLTAAIKDKQDLVQYMIHDQKKIMRHYDNKPQEAERLLANIEDGLELYRKSFEKATRVEIRITRGRHAWKMHRMGTITELMDRVLELLREDAAALQKSMELDPEGTKETWGWEIPTEFDLHGMKVVVDDRTVTKQQFDDYVGYLKKTYSLMQSKGVGKAWYGTIFIQCQECGGVNPNGAQFGVGGWFRIDKNTVSIFSRPAERLPHLIAHELGHRYWYRHMSSGQRKEFEDMITLTPENPEWILRNWKMDNDSWYDLLNWGLGKLQEGSTAVNYGALNHACVEKTRNIFWNLYKSLGDAFDSETAASVSKQLDLDRLNEQVNNLSSDIYLPLIGPDTDWADLKKRADRLYAVASEIGKKLTDLKLRERVWPVSEYGFSNIDEAFAEVFASYVVGKGINNRSQVDSFKHVMRLARQTVTPVATSP